MKLQTDCDIIFFVSSSGHCNFSCKYCIINPIAKHQPSLNYQDFKFLFDQFKNKKAFLAFSGVGDFFAGYRKSDLLLSNILEHDVEIALDINGSSFNEYKELSYEKLSKIRFINLTMHYDQIKKRNLNSLWSQNALLMHEINGKSLTIDYVLSPILRQEWEEALLYYENEVFSKTGIKLLLVRDINKTFSQEDEDKLEGIFKKFKHLISGEHQENFAQIFSGKNKVLCPAGNSYFRIWNDGKVQGCPNLPHIKTLFENGNIKERRISINPNYFYCTTPQYCDCNVIESLGKMKYVS